MPAPAVLSGPAVERERALQDFHCQGCGRRLFQYTPDPLQPGKLMRFRCRCKTWSELHGNQAVAALRAVTQEASS